MISSGPRSRWRSLSPAVRIATMEESIRYAPANPDADLIPVRMCNELVYCPRLFHLEHVQGIFLHSADTIEGSGQHERAKRRGVKQRVPNQRAAGATKEQLEALPESWRPTSSNSVAPLPADDLFGKLPRRMQLASEELGVRGEIDLVEIDDGSIVVVEAKHGRAPRRADHRWEDYALPYVAWPADVIQVTLYIMLLRELGLPCNEARILYRASNTSTTIAWSPELEHFARAVIARAREVAAMDVPPLPLLDSPKCAGCSLHEVCLPDEHHALVAEQAERERPLGMRKIVAGCDERAVVHVLTPGSVVRKDGDALLVMPPKKESERFLLKDVSHVALFGPVTITEPCMQHLLRSGIATSHHTTAGRLLGMTTPLATRNIGLRRAQYRAADDPSRCLEIARALVTAKIRNQRTVLRRHRRGLSVISDEGRDEPIAERTTADEELDHVPASGAQTDDERREHALEPERDKHDPFHAVALALQRMHHAQRSAERTQDIDTLRGYEGEAAARYFEVFSALLPIAWRDDFEGRSRRPPRDRVNALMSFGYMMLVREAVAALARIGLDPMLGLFHTMIPGRPALALDIIEPFRAAWVDTAVLRLIGTRGIERTNFHVSAAGVELSDAGRRALVHAYERRAAELTTHPRFGYRMSYRRLLELEARILAKVLVGELEHYTPLWTR